MTPEIKARNIVIQYLPSFLQNEVCRMFEKYGGRINEIRLRVERPAVVMLADRHIFLCPDRQLTSGEITACFEKMCDYSIYSRQNEISKGFITLPGGNRVGICGSACVDKSGNRTVKYISSLNIRFAGEYKGCSDKIFDMLYSERIYGILIAGPPCSGKTTLLKDIALKLSSSPYFKKTVIVDERDELAAMSFGKPLNTLGDFCDVLSGYPKGEGILNAVRTLSPEAIICDEIGGREDAEAVSEAVNSGIVVISSIHACNADELYRKETIRKLLKSGTFEKIVFLKGGSARCEAERIFEVDNEK